jgi:hypothetical protein
MMPRRQVHDLDFDSIQGWINLIRDPVSTADEVDQLMPVAIALATAEVEVIRAGIVVDVPTTITGAPATALLLVIKIIFPIFQAVVCFR